jgi:tRNA 2-thiouridine synthesizing protein B
MADMSVLHIITRSPHESRSLELCLERAGVGDTVLLIENAVYAAAQDSIVARHIERALPRTAVCVLGPDLEARGFQTVDGVPGVARIDYADFVDLTVRHHVAVSW